MMNSDFGAPAYSSAAGYSTVESLLDEAASNLKRYSRGSNSQKTAGSMRVVKPNSSSNSPRGAIGLGRRRTVMTDRRRMAMVDQSSDVFVSNDGLQIPPKSNRPVSWHPSSHLEPQSLYHHPPLPMQYSITNNEFHIFDLPPTPAAYSGYTSPASTFSPLSVPFTGYEQQYSYMDSSLPCSSSANYTLHEQVSGQQAPNYISTPCDNTDSTIYSHFDWSSFAVNGFERSTAPPTPENFLPIQHPDPTFPADDAIPYHSLSDSTQEEEGEILCGMGLYDSPDAGKNTSFDPQLDNYRSSMMSQMFGSAYRIESTGKGLKLEETWNPPASDNEDDDDDDDEQDGEGEDEDDDIVEAENHEAPQNSDAQKPYNVPDARSSPPPTTPSNFAARNHDRISWL